MRVIQKPQNAGERVVALGTFDGVHRGHRALLLTARQLADELGVPLRVCTFNRPRFRKKLPSYSAREWMRQN